MVDELAQNIKAKKIYNGFYDLVSIRELTSHRLQGEIEATKEHIEELSSKSYPKRPLRERSYFETICLLTIRLNDLRIELSNRKL